MCSNRLLQENPRVSAAAWLCSLRSLKIRALSSGICPKIWKCNNHIYDIVLIEKMHYIVTVRLI